MSELSDIPRDTAELMTELARSLQSQADTVESTLALITRYAVQIIPDAEYAGVSLVRGQRSVETHSPTAALVVDLDQAQYETSEGPCLSALRESDMVRVDDITKDSRWPTWRARVQDAGIASMLSFQLFASGDTLGALNLYAVTLGAFGEDDEVVGRMFAAHAAVALADAQEIAGIRTALANRDVIGQAKGILMQRYTIDANAAFELLVRASQTSHVKLHEVARRITTDFG